MWSSSLSRLTVGESGMLMLAWATVIRGVVRAGVGVRMSLVVFGVVGGTVVGAEVVVVSEVVGAEEEVVSVV